MRHKIHVPLLADPSVLRESDAVPAGEGCFRLAASQGERLLFKRGEIVECDIRTLPGGSKGLVAIRSISADSEFRKRRNTFAVCGAVIGALFGAVVALEVGASLLAVAIAGVLGAATFAYCSVRWGDPAWKLLFQLLD